jgi:hypothetical protein
MSLPMGFIGSGKIHSELAALEHWFFDTSSVPLVYYRNYRGVEGAIDTILYEAAAKRTLTEPFVNDAAARQNQLTCALSTRADNHTLHVHATQRTELRIVQQKTEWRQEQCSIQQQRILVKKLYASDVYRCRLAKGVAEETSNAVLDRIMFAAIARYEENHLGDLNAPWNKPGKPTVHYLPLSPTDKHILVGFWRHNLEHGPAALITRDKSLLYVAQHSAEILHPLVGTSIDTRLLWYTVYGRTPTENARLDCRN